MIGRPNYLPKAILLDFVNRYGPNAGAEGPVLFVREVLGAEPEPYQLDALRAFGRGERRIAFRSCHGVGKTALAAWLCLVMLLTRFPQKTAVTAPTKNQLEDALLAEIGMWLKKLPEPLQGLFDVTKHRIVLREAPDSSFLSAKTARDENPEALQGIHADNVLLVADEASGVTEKVFEAAAGSMSGTGAVTLLLGNPVRSTGFFYDAFHSMRDIWHCIHVTGVPGTTIPGDAHSYYSKRVSPDFLLQIERTYGKGTNAWLVRAEGQFPKSDANTIIPFEIIELARQRDIENPPRASEVWGLDVARYGEDSNALVRRTKLTVLPLIETWEGRDLMYTTGRLKSAFDAAEIKPDLILVDEIGLGAGVVDRARELGLPVRGVNVSEREGVDGKYFNLRTQLWFEGRQWLDARNRALPRACTCGKCVGRDDHAEMLARELALTRYDIAESSGKWQAEPKKALKQRGYASPNVADAFLLTLAGEVASLMHGSTNANNFAWNEPLRRKRSIV